MGVYTSDFSVDVQGVKGVCPAGEAYAKQQIAAKTIPVLSCEGPCIRGEIATLPLYNKYTDVFLMEDVPEDERKTVARQVADRISATLTRADALAG